MVSVAQVIPCLELQNRETYRGCKLEAYCRPLGAIGQQCTVQAFQRSSVLGVLVSGTSASYPSPRAALQENQG